MKDVESNCPTLNETAAVLYKASYAFFMKQKEQVQNFTDDLPESMRSALVKMYNITMMLYNEIHGRGSMDVSLFGPNSTVIEILEACEEFLNAPEEDRKTAAKNDTLWTSLFTGDLRDSSLEWVRALKKFFVIKDDMRNYEQDVDREALITTYTSLSQAWRKWLKIAKSELLAYFETRTRPWTSACLEPWLFECRSVPFYFLFSRDLGHVYNHNYNKWFDYYDY
uniref:Uncharacterized protein n=1 Tax=Acrobeloides nanus TaxID=290746 RepID=A0A914CLW4_9BILA